MDLKIYFKKLWIKRIFLIKISIIGFIVGLVIALTKPQEYTTTVLIAPESSTSSTGSMGSLAALAGVAFGSPANSAISSPDLYPDVIESTPFIKGLFDITVKDSQQQIETTLYNYIKQYQNISWWGSLKNLPSRLMGMFTSKEEPIGANQINPRILTKEELDVISNLKTRLFISSDKKTGLTTITVTMQSPEISAYVADTLTTYLQSYIIDYRTQKARKDLAYAEKLYEESQANFYNVQKQLAAFVDGNMNVVSAKYRINQDRLQNEATLTASVYNQMAQQLQMARVKIQDTTPVFTVIQPAIQPLNPSGISKKMLLIGFIFIAFMGASLWVLRKDIFEGWKRMNRED